MSIDFGKLIHGDDAARKGVLEDFYKDLLKANRNAQIQKIVEMIENLARETDDDNYSHICKLSMEVLLSLKNVNLKEIMAVRLEAQFELPEEDRLVDSVNLLRAIESMPEKEKLLDLIKSIER